MDRVPTFGLVQLPPVRRDRRTCTLPSSRRFGQGASTCPGPADEGSRRPEAVDHLVVAHGVGTQGRARPRSRSHAARPRAITNCSPEGGATTSATAADQPSAVTPPPEERGARWIRVRCVNACGTFPIKRWCSWSYSSEKMPRSFRERQQPFEQREGLLAPSDHRRGRFTSQKLHARKAPSPGGRPSAALSSGM